MWGTPHKYVENTRHAKINDQVRIRCHSVHICSHRKPLTYPRNFASLNHTYPSQAAFILLTAFNWIACKDNFKSQKCEMFLLILSKQTRTFIHKFCFTTCFILNILYWYISFFSMNGRLNIQSICSIDDVTFWCKHWSHPLL